MTRRSVIITGAARGVGAACARRFAKEGDFLTLVDMDENAGNAITRELKETYEHVSFVHANISSRLHIHNILAEALESYDKVDILVNADIYHHFAPFLDMGEEDFLNVIQQNLTGAFLINQAVAKQFIRQIENADHANSNSDSTQTIINLSTNRIYDDHHNHIALEASMGGLKAMNEAIARTISQYGIRSNIISIGTMRGENEEESKFIPLDNIGEPEDVANVAWFLASSEAKFITGETIFVGKKTSQPPATITSE